MLGEGGIYDEMRQTGIECCGMELSGRQCSMAEASVIRPDPTIGAVVVGFDVNLNYCKLAHANNCFGSGYGS
jgi:4-nitrophenyl phosphatase